MSEYQPRHHNPDDENDPRAAPEGIGGPAPEDLQPAVGFDPEHLPPRPGIWVADDASSMRGEWIDATLDPTVLRIAIDGRAIYDTIGFGTFVLEPGENPEVISRVARGIQQHGEAFAAWAQLHDADPEMLNTFEHAYLGTYPTAGAWMAEELDKAGILRQIWAAARRKLGPYISLDFEGLATQAIHDGVVVTVQTDRGVCLFRGPAES